jgi:hypothetical protein
MGLLDDAIRDHLELKRRRGADPSEVEREENEALGPPRRGVFADRTEEPQAPADDLEPAAAAPPPDTGELEPYDAELDEAEPEEVWAEPDPAAEHRVRPAPADEDPWLDEPDEVPPDDALQHGALGQPTAEFSAAELDEAEGPEDGEAEHVLPDDEPEPEAEREDVLEETPDFLQETPEHDRLWFEQKPPRRFDWDK